MKTLLCTACLSLVLLSFASTDSRSVKKETSNCAAYSSPAQDTIPKKDTSNRKDTIRRDTLRFF
ncbi:MAG: hypothetical protein E6Q24_11855 [Chitinophagaceae bacterium]|nr:hypothetical protein [Sphingobacteriales bacterium]TXJ26310.1 MAG: hypothetical protein E6Q24_11855 [Chitinophagaceae bacterium]